MWMGNKALQCQIAKCEMADLGSMIKKAKSIPDLMGLPLGEEKSAVDDPLRFQ